MKGFLAWLRADEATGPKLFTLIAGAYWALFSLVTPVTVWDSQTYNLARLELARLGGLFGNPYWNSGRQVFLPWTFDAVHLPFLRLGFGAALPSFACLAGLLVIVFRMAAARFGRAVGWWCCAALLSLPTLVYQATSTKNDLAVVFALACWLYSLDRYRADSRARFLFLMALGLGFAAGSKTSGLIFAVPLILWTFWALRGSGRACAIFAGALAVTLVCWGSGEIYLNNLRLYGQWLAPREFVEGLRNRDGAAGALANFIRYAIGNTSIGLDGMHPARGLIRTWDLLCRAVLSWTHLTDVGYAGGYRDSTLHFWKDGWEASSDFGFLGGVAFWFSLYAVFARRWQDPVWRLSAAGVGCLLVTCLSTGWMPWNSRFLIAPFVLSAVALAIAVARSSAGARVGLMAAILFSGCVLPIYSFNKNPASLMASITDRRAFETRVVTGIASTQYFEVKEGLKEGDRVLTGPIRKLKELKDRAQVKLRRLADGAAAKTPGKPAAKPEVKP